MEVTPLIQPKPPEPIDPMKDLNEFQDYRNKLATEAATKQATQRSTLETNHSQMLFTAKQLGALLAKPGPLTPEMAQEQIDSIHQGGATTDQQWQNARGAFRPGMSDTEVRDVLNRMNITTLDGVAQRTAIYGKQGEINNGASIQPGTFDPITGAFKSAGNAQTLYPSPEWRNTPQPTMVPDPAHPGQFVPATRNQGDIAAGNGGVVAPPGTPGSGGTGPTVNPASPIPTTPGASRPGGFPGQPAGGAPPQAPTAPGITPAPASPAPPVPATPPGATVTGNNPLVVAKNEDDLKQYREDETAQPQRESNVRNLQIASDALDLVATGNNSENLNKMRGYAVYLQKMLGLEPAGDVQNMAYDELKKTLTNYAASAVGKVGTNAGLEAAFKANANGEINSKAALNMVIQNIGSERLAQAVYKTAPDNLGGGYNTHRAAQNGNLDPRAFALDMYNTPARAKELKDLMGAMTPPELAKFKDSIRVASKLGLLNMGRQNALAAQAGVPQPGVPLPPVEPNNPLQTPPGRGY